MKLSLCEIAQWQLNSEQSEVELPSVQRGFVWKPKQVEDLWDSLLREYPIGSFLFSQTGEKKYLMDGQQRATSIFLGFFNPYDIQNTTKAWSIKGELPVIWIDLQPNNKPDASKYLIRLTTRSHPWGYQAKNNDNKLSVPERRTALDIFRKNNKNVDGYTSFENTTVFPYDACYPLPLCFFIESETVEQIVEKAKTYLPDYFCTKSGGFENKAGFLNILQTEELEKNIQDILYVVKKTKKRIINYDIISNSVLEEEQETEDPTLFVRINSAGTRLSGDDLIYSIYKATFQNAKELVEDIGSNFIAPTQVISMASRIAWSAINNNKFPTKMNVRQFQQNIKNDEFKNKLQKLIEQKTVSSLFEQAINILKCKDNTVGEIPPVLIKQFINKSQDLFLFFIYWLYVHNDYEINDVTKLKMLAKLLSFSWFERNINMKELWIREIDKKDFWVKPLNEHICWDPNGDWNDYAGIHFLLPPELLKSYYQQESVETLFLENDGHKWELYKSGIGEKIIEHYNKVKSTNFTLDEINNYYFFPGFIGKLMSNKSFILFAQRNYINSEFKDFNQMENIEDTNVPWDWDHIYPNNWVYYKQGIPQSIKDWNNTNGNFRAISLEQNRSESNIESPNSRLKDKNNREISFVLENDWQYWQMIDDRRIESKEKALNHFRAVTNRMINIYEKFWNDLKIYKLID
jgi:hypothetical protein